MSHEILKLSNKHRGKELPRVAAVETVTALNSCDAVGSPAKERIQCACEQSIEIHKREYK